MVSVVKANGEIEPFNEDKVLKSIRRARIPRDLHGQVLDYIKQDLYEKIPTSEIYNHITEYLGRSPEPFAKAKYTLKQAIMLLGPSGYPFEDFVARLLETKGYTTQVRQILTGRCVNHEVDVIAEKEGSKALIEAKFHNNPGIRSDVHVALYTKARFDDVKEKYALSEAWIVTNTKTTSDAEAFANCSGMKVISWSYPDGGSLRDLVEASGLHPITMLTTLSNAQKQMLLINHVIMCKELMDNQQVLNLLNLTPEEKHQTLQEVQFVVNTEM